MNIISNINGYKLDTSIADYPSGSLIEFGANGYEWATTFGMNRLFKNEKYFWVENRIFLGRESKEALAATINDVIYKISFRFNDTNTDSCVDFREKVYNYLANEMGLHHSLDEIDSVKVFMWASTEGNVILELDVFDTAIILTSSSIRNAKQISKSIFGRFFSR
jgi:hypothetical protein